MDWCKGRCRGGARQPCRRQPGQPRDGCDRCITPGSVLRGSQPRAERCSARDPCRYSAQPPWPRPARGSISMKRPLSLPLVLIAFGLTLAGCYATAGYDVPYEEDYWDEPPPAFVATAPVYYYEGRPTYWYHDHWHFREGRHWRRFRSEPPALRGVRPAPRVERFPAPVARPMPAPGRAMPEAGRPMPGPGRAMPAPMPGPGRAMPGPGRATPPPGRAMPPPGRAMPGPNQPPGPNRGVPRMWEHPGRRER
jgi:hypothetical protein